MYKRTGNNDLDLKYQKSLKFSLLDGAFFAFMLGIGEYYISAYIISLGANNLQIGLIGTLPIFLASILQIYGPQLISELNSRKKAVFLPSLIRTITWIPIILGWSLGANKIWLIIFATTIYFTTNHLAAVPWISWMGDLVEETQRSNYFAKRNKISSIVAFIGTILGGVILDLTKLDSIKGFIIIFIISFLSSLLSTIFIYKKTDIPFIEEKEDKFTLKEFTSNLNKTTFGKFTIFNSIFNMAIFISAPFFVAHQLNVLNLTYIEYMIGLTLMTFSKSIFFKPFANYTQKHGNVRLLTLSLILITTIPIFWIFVTKAWEIYILNFFSGIGWAGFELLSIEFLYDSVKPSQRSRNSSYMTFYKGIGILAGGIVGTIIVKITRQPYILIFLISGIIRLLSLIYFSKEIKELKNVEPIKFEQLFFKIISTIPREGISTTMIGIENTKNKIKLIKPPQFKKKIRFSND